MKNRIREHRKARGWKIAHLADVVGTSISHISGIETGKREPSQKMLEMIANALGKSVAELYAPENEDEARIIQHMVKFEKLADEDRAAVEKLTNALLSQQGG